MVSYLLGQKYKRARAFIYGLLKHLTLKGGVTFYLGEIYALLLVFLQPKSIKYVWNSKAARAVILVLVGYLLGQILSNIIVNTTAKTDLIKGLANTGMATVLFIYLFRQMDNGLHLILWILFGESLSLLLSACYFGLETFTDIHEMFKAVGSPALHNLLLIFGFFALRKSLAPWKISSFFFLYGLLTIYFDARWYGLSFVILSVLVLLKDFFLGLSGFKKLAVMVSLLAGGMLLFLGYVQANISGNLNNPRIQRQLTLVENPYNPIHVLKIGRAETYTAFQAIMEKPWSGYGDWARDPKGSFYTDYLELRGYGDFVKKYPDYGKDKPIPNHSVILGAWLYTGIIGLLAMVFLCGLLVFKSIKILRSGALTQNRFQLITMYFLINGIWVFFFSPIQHLRHTVVFYLAFLLVQERKLFFDTKSINQLDA